MYSGLRSNCPLSRAGAETFRAPMPIAVRSTVYPLASSAWA